MKKTDVFIKIAMTTILLGLNSIVLANEVKQQRESEKTPTTYAPFTNKKVKSNETTNRVVVQGSFIYWQADMDGLDFALEQSMNAIGISNTGSTPNVTSLSYGDIMKNKDLNFKWDPGFKLGVGLIFGDADEWDIMLNWTWLQSIAKRNESTRDPATFNQVNSGGSVRAEATFGDFLIPAPSANFLGAPAVNAGTRWRMHYNTLDLELGRCFLIARNLTIHPHVGIRAAWINHNIKMDYDLASLVSGFTPFSVLGTASTLPITSGNLIGDSQFEGKNEYSAVGLRGGFDIRWNFNNYFCIYSSLAGAVVYGEYEIEENFEANYTVNTLSPTGTVTATTSTFGTGNLYNSYNRTRTNIQAILGLMAHFPLFNGKHHIFCSAGYEVNEWFQQNELRSIDGDVIPFTLKSNRTSGDLGLHGINLDIRYEF